MKEVHEERFTTPLVTRKAFANAGAMYSSSTCRSRVLIQPDEAKQRKGVLTATDEHGQSVKVELHPSYG